MVDLSAFDEWGLLVSYRLLRTGGLEFIDFTFAPS